MDAADTRVTSREGPGRALLALTLRPSSRSLGAMEEVVQDGEFSTTTYDHIYANTKGIHKDNKKIMPDILHCMESYQLNELHVMLKES